jgi:AbrB family looped-hinge helix DNA binding protein
MVSMEPQVVEVGPKGRIVIPAAMRRALGLAEGSQLVARVEGGALMLVPKEAIRRRLRDRFAPVEGSMADELIKERREEAAREAGR